MDLTPVIHPSIHVADLGILETKICAVMMDKGIENENHLQTTPINPHTLLSREGKKRNPKEKKLSLYPAAAAASPKSQMESAHPSKRPNPDLDADLTLGVRRRHLPAAAAAMWLES